MIINFEKDWKWKIPVLPYFEHNFLALASLSLLNGQASHRGFFLQNL